MSRTRLHSDPSAQHSIQHQRQFKFKDTSAPPHCCLRPIFAVPTASCCENRPPARTQRCFTWQGRDQHRTPCCSLLQSSGRHAHSHRQLVGASQRACQQWLSYSLVAMEHHVHVLWTIQMHAGSAHAAASKGSGRRCSGVVSAACRMPNRPVPIGTCKQDAPCISAAAQCKTMSQQPEHRSLQSL